MNVFLAALRMDGLPITRRELFAPIARLPKNAEWTSCTSGAFCASAQSGRAPVRPLLAQYRNMMGVGDVRLDNRSELAAMAGVSNPTASDLEIVLAAIDRCGADVVTRMYGDFCFVSWDPNGQRLTAARDAFGVKPLFYRRTPEHLLISSRLDVLCGDEQLDRDYIAEFLLGMPSPGPHTIWQGTMQVEPGALLVQRGSVTAQSRYWTPATFQPTATLSENDAVEQFRQLFFESVGERISGDDTWSHLSGGLDSSAVVCTAHALHERGLSSRLGGTVTISDTLGTGDESRYCAAVIGKCGARNETLRDYWAWRNDYGMAPRATDEPTPLFPFFARERQTVDVVSGNGGGVLLSGLGADHYISGTLAYMADMVAHGQLRAGAREVMQWSLQLRRSFWHTARAHIVEPFLNSASPGRGVTVPRWLRSDFAHSHRVRDRLADVRNPRVRAGEFFRAHTAAELRAMAGWMLRGPYQERLDVRYPFLSRRLVEFTLSLPVNMRVRPQGRKWILREAMRGILPEEVRTRQGKGGIDARVLWSLQREKHLVDVLMHDPILGQIGCIDVTELRKTVELARQGAWQNTVQVFSILALESWLRARLARWPVTTSTTQTAA